jgi:putative endonuclease
MVKWFKRIPFIDRLVPQQTEPEHLRTGRWGEKMAAEHLRTCGMKVVGSRVRVGRHDELDLIARDGDLLIFVEVKTRRHERYGRPATAVNQAKRKRMSRAIVRYVKRMKTPPKHIRIDIIEVLGSPNDGVQEVRVIQNAFSLEGYSLWW